MRDGALKWGLRLLGLLLFIGPILVAFSMNGWDLRETVLPSNEEIGLIQNQLNSAVFSRGFSADMITYGTPVINGNNVSVDLTFRSPLNVDATILSFDVGVNDQGLRVGELHLQDGAVMVPANGTVKFTLAGTYSSGALVDPQADSISVLFEVYGVTIQLQTSAGGQQL